MNPELKKLIDGISAIAESCGVFYKSCLAQGFTPPQTLELTKSFLTATIIRPTDKNDE
jgi:hypothetical protein